MRFRWLAVAGVVFTVACGSRATVLPEPSVAPHFPEFVQPRVPASLAGSVSATAQERAWQFLQAGDLRNAEREAAAALKATPRFSPAETTLGYINLAKKDQKDALVQFDRALEREPNDPSALAGRGEALAALGRDAEAVDAYRAALGADPSLTNVSRRIEVLSLRGVQRDVAAARAAARAGKPDDAMQGYRAAIARSPDSAFLYREVAAIEKQQGLLDAALEDYRKAIALDPGDSGSLIELADLLTDRGELDAAMKAYNDALAIEPDPAAEKKRDELRARAEFARFPPSYRAIETAAQISRSDLAALIGVRLAAIVDAASARDVGVITDIRGHWAEQWMIAVSRAGIMDPFANHTFQPRTVIRRSDFAQAVTRVLRLVPAVAPGAPRRWEGARGRFPDMSTTHVAYAAASEATAAGVMAAAADGSFQPSRAVSGAEAIEAIERMRAIINPPAQTRGRP
jgi:tetratricopeptide (TPR) repeat protein